MQMAPDTAAKPVQGHMRSGRDPRVFPSSHGLADRVGPFEKTYLSYTPSWYFCKRVVISNRARAARGQQPTRPAFSIGSTTISEPRDGVVEAVVIVRGRARVRAVAIRLEGLDARWRATAINVL